MAWKRWFVFNLFYLRRPPWDTGISPPELVTFVQKTPAGRALDLGCGTGTNAVYLAQHGWQTTGVDFVAKAVRQAKRKARQAGVAVDLRVGDVTRLEGISGPFDLILDIGCYHSLGETGKKSYRANLDRLLAAAGTYLMYAFVRPDGDSAAGPGLSEADVAALKQSLHLANRQEGADRGGRSSAWFTFLHE